MDGEKSEDETIYIDTHEAVHNLFTDFKLPAQLRSDVEIPVGKSNLVQKLTTRLSRNIWWENRFLTAGSERKVNYD